mmetsp:Transcript_36685/g.116778  ORF Transcript_36685/g.116778 Transcript_36685/m.116778 type:complete len:312 (-) Transcript_36685:1277-2212(-)
MLERATVRLPAIGGKDPGVEGDVLAADHGAIHVPVLLAPRNRALAAVEGHVGAELRLLGLVEIAGVPHRDLQAPDPSDAKLPGASDHHLVVEVIEHPCDAGGVDVLGRIGVFVLGAVDVERVLLVPAALSVPSLVPVGRDNLGVWCGDAGGPTVDELGRPQVTTVGNHLHLDLVLGECQVHKAVLVVVAAIVRVALRGHAAAPARDDPSGGVQEVALEAGPPLVPHVRSIHEVHLLPVPVASEDEVDAVLPGHLHPVLAAPRGGEVRHHNLPLGRGLGQDLVKPIQLVLPELLEPSLAVVWRQRPLRPTGA